MSNSVSRRAFLNLIARGGSTAAAVAVGNALGILPGVAGAAAPPSLQPVSGQGKRVVILGAGLSGLTAAYQLTRAGYDCQVLEASHRPGGRVFTVRSGDLIDELGNPQICRFDDEPHMYFNAGAARIPSTHENVLHYCRQLGVELEIFINENKRAWVQDDNLLDGQPVRNGELSTHLRGFMAHMMHRGFTEAELDEPFTDEEAEKLLSLFRSFGDLNNEGEYTGSTRAGYATGGFLEHGTQKEIIELRDILEANPYMLRTLVTANEGETGPVLMQPVGGMDKIVYGFTRQLEDRITYEAPVKSIMLRDDGVEVMYEQDGEQRSMEADYCFNCIPSHLLTGIEHNFPTHYVNALKYIRRGEAFKAAFQANGRFWEDQGIYGGGISWTNQPIRQIWYPPHGLHKQKGVILAAYDYGGGMHFTRMSQQERIEALKSQGEKVHPDYRQYVEHGITIAWHRMNHMLGCAASWPSFEGEGADHYETLSQPVGRHFLIGDQVTQHSAWMESAIQSAHRALSQMDEMERSQGD